MVTLSDCADAFFSIRFLMKFGEASSLKQLYKFFRYFYVCEIVLLHCCFVSCFSSSQNSKIKDVFCRNALSSSQKSFTDQVTHECAGSITTDWPLFFRTRLKNFLWTVLAKSLPNNVSVEVNLQLLFFVLYNTVNASLMFLADYQCFTNS